MEANAVSLAFLANENIIKIPFFQRAYVWVEDNWAELLTDLLDFNKKQFFGSLILKQVQTPAGEVTQRLVIDGQQRLTTLSILLRALYNSFDEGRKKHADSRLKQLLFYEDQGLYTEGVFIIKIEHSKVDKENYSKVIEDGIDPLTIDAKKEPSKILQCYRYFTDALSEIDYDKRLKLFNKLCNKDNHILVVINLDANDNEQAIFDTINSAGVRLSGADIVKNAIFQKAIELGNQKNVEALYNDYWGDIFSGDEDAIAYWEAKRQTGRLVRDNIELLLHSIAVIEGFFDPEKHTLSDIPNLYKDHIKDFKFEELKKFIKDIAKYAQLYNKKMLTLDDNQFSFTNFEARLFHILKVCDISTFHPYILSLYLKYENDPERIKTELAKLETFILRRAVAESSETKNYNRLCKDFINDSSKIDELLPEVTDESVKRGLAKINNKMAALLLFWVELHRRANEAQFKDITELKYEYSLEHIMPQQWIHCWNDIPVIDEDGNEISEINEPERRKSYRYGLIYSIGNMTLLKRALNTSLRNYEFKRKIEGEGKNNCIRKHSELTITRDIIDAYDRGDTVWDERKIRERTSKLADEILSIWKAV